MSSTHEPGTHHYLAITMHNSRYVTIAARVSINERVVFNYKRSDDSDEPLVKVEGQDLPPARSIVLTDQATVTFGREFQRQWNAKDRRFEPR